MSLNICETFKNGIKAIRAFVFRFNIVVAIAGKIIIIVKGDSALCASLKLFALLAIILRSVVLPAPLGPKIPIISPFFATKFISSLPKILLSFYFCYILEISLLYS